MAKRKKDNKYVFNPKTLSFDRFKESVWVRVGRVFLFIGTAFVFGFLLMLLAFFFFGSPKEKMQARELEYMNLQYQILNDKLDELEVLVADMEQRDNDVYRVIFDADPIPSQVRRTGFMKVDRYEDLYGYKNSEVVLAVASKFDMIASQLYYQSKSYDEVFEMARNKSQMLACIPAIIPLKEWEIRQISSYFGYRTDPIYMVPKFHSGIDFAAPIGTEVFATGDGVVCQEECNYWGYGNLLSIDHGYGYTTNYAHLSKFAVKKGQKVKRGQLIGYVGNTGKATGSHLHYEVLKNGTPIDPINFFYNDLSPEEYEKILEQAASPSISMD